MPPYAVGHHSSSSVRSLLVDICWHQTIVHLYSTPRLSKYRRRGLALASIRMPALGAFFLASWRRTIAIRLLLALRAWFVCGDSTWPRVQWQSSRLLSTYNSFEATNVSPCSVSHPFLCTVISFILGLLIRSTTHLLHCRWSNGLGPTTSHHWCRPVSTILSRSFTSSPDSNELMATHLTSISVFLLLTIAPTGDMDRQLLSPPLSHLLVSTTTASRTIAEAIPARAPAAWHRPMPCAGRIEVGHLGQNTAPSFLSIWSSATSRGRVLVERQDTRARVWLWHTVDSDFSLAAGVFCRENSQRNNHLGRVRRSRHVWFYHGQSPWATEDHRGGLDICEDWQSYVCILVGLYVVWREFWGPQSSLPTYIELQNYRWAWPCEGEQHHDSRSTPAIYWEMF